MSLLTFPIPVSALSQWVPHRLPMVWINEVTSASAEGGECLIKLDAQAHYIGSKGIRSSSLVEWMAQGYAYVRAVQSVHGLLAAMAAPKRAYLVSIQNVQFLADLSSLESGRSLTVRVGGYRDIGPITMFEGSVIDETGRKLATARLKVFAE